MEWVTSYYFSARYDGFRVGQGRREVMGIWQELMLGQCSLILCALNIPQYQECFAWYVCFGRYNVIMFYEAFKGSGAYACT